MELVVGVGLVVVVAGAIAITTIQSLKNTKFSKNQVEATKIAQGNIEKVRTIKNSNFGVCKQSEQPQPGTVCSSWADIWTIAFGKQMTTCTNGCTFKIVNGCDISNGSTTETKPFCLSYIDPAIANRANLGNGFTGVVVIEDESALVFTTQKRVTSRVFWTDSTGEHSSDLVTILSRI